MTISIPCSRIASAAVALLTSVASAKRLPMNMTGVFELGEFAKHCMYSYVLDFELCNPESFMGPNYCRAYSLNAAYFQKQMHAYYDEGAAPPLDLAYMLARQDDETQNMLMNECAPFVVLSFLLVAESQMLKKTLKLHQNSLRNSL